MLNITLALTLNTIGLKYLLERPQSRPDITTQVYAWGGLGGGDDLRNNLTLTRIYIGAKPRVTYHYINVQ